MNFNHVLSSATELMISHTFLMIPMSISVAFGVRCWPLAAKWPQILSEADAKSLGVLKRILNKACHPGGYYCSYYPGALSLSQVTATDLKSGHP